MSKGLKALEELIGNHCLEGRLTGIIEKELLALKIIKEKELSAEEFIEFINRYSDDEEARIKFNEKQWTRSELTREQFILIKEVLIDE